MSEIKDIIDNDKAQVSALGRADAGGFLVGNGALHNKYIIPKDMRGNTKLKEKDREDIRIMHFVGVTQREIASKYNVHPSLISRIISGKKPTRTKIKNSKVVAMRRHKAYLKSLQRRREISHLLIKKAENK